MRYTTTFPVNGQRRKVSIEETTPHEFHIWCDDASDPTAIMNEDEIIALVHEYRQREREHTMH